MEVEVETYSGYRADERPLRFRAGGNSYDVTSVLDRWYSPDSTWFKVEAEDGRRYILRHYESADVWTLESLVA